MGVKKPYPQDIGLAKELVWIFPYNFIEEPEWNSLANPVQGEQEDGTF